MIIIGISIAQADIKRILGCWQIYVTSFMRLLFIPILTAFFCLLVGIRGDLLVLAVILFATPAASTTAVIAAMYDVAVDEASSIIVFSTLLSAATIPLILILIPLITG